MRLNCGEGNGVSLAGRTSQSTDRIARIIVNMGICRAFLRSVLPCVIDGHGMDTDRKKVPLAYRSRRNVAICNSFVLDLTLAVDAVDTFPAFTYGLLITLYMYPSTGQYTCSLRGSASGS